MMQFNILSFGIPLVKQIFQSFPLKHKNRFSGTPRTSGFSWIRLNLLFHLSGFAHAIAQIVELRAPHPPGADNLHLCNVW